MIGGTSPRCHILATPSTTKTDPPSKPFLSDATKTLSRPPKGFLPASLYDK